MKAKGNWKESHFLGDISFIIEFCYLYINSYMLKTEQDHFPHISLQTEE